MRRNLVLVMGLTSVLVAFAAGLSADPVYMSVTGQTQGAIQGSVVMKGFEGGLQVYQISHDIVYPRDASSGLPTGPRQHRALTATIAIDRSAPMLMKALITNERLTTVELLLPEPGAKLVTTAGYRIRLTNASISRVLTTFPDPTMTRVDRPVLQVSFVYESIEWTWVREGITAEDDWESPVS